MFAGEAQMIRTIGPAKRLRYAFIGLLAGDATLMLSLLRWWPFSESVVLLEIYGLFSLFGWLLIGLPVALWIPPDAVTRLSWPSRLLVGAALGPVALLLILIVLNTPRLSRLSFRGTGGMWFFSLLVSTVGFMVYAALLQKEQSR